MKTEISDIDSLDSKIWDDYIFSHPLADHYHLSGWGKVIKMAYAYEPLYVTAWEGTELQGVLPVVIMGGVLRRKSLVSLPFLDYGGICAADPEVQQRLYEAVVDESMKRRGGLLDLRHRRETSVLLESYGDKVTMILALEDSAEAMWKKLSGKVRNQIRKAEKEQLWTQWVDDDGLRDFYHVYTYNMRDLGSPPHSLKFFQCILAEFPDARVILVRLGEKVIGAGLCLAFKDTIIVPWASSLRPYMRLCPNNLLYWEVMRTACGQGLRQLDFGRSSQDSGTYKFKKQWGALEEPLHWQSNAPGGDLVDKSANPLLGFVESVWKNLPVSVTRWVGPTLRRRLSN